MRRLIVSILVLCFLIVGCSTKNNPEHAITSVINFMLICPDEKLEPLIQQGITKIGIV